MQLLLMVVKTPYILEFCATIVNISIVTHVLLSLRIQNM
jgi:hypothetical protein